MVCTLLHENGSILHHAHLGQNEVSEKAQRWGSKTIEGSGHVSVVKYGAFLPARSCQAG